MAQTRRSGPEGRVFDSLITKAYGAVTVAPLYPRAAAVAPKSLRRTPGRWSILGRVDYAPPEPANRLALDDLEGGADGLHLVFAGSQGAYGGGLTDDGAAALAKVLKISGWTTASRSSLRLRPPRRRFRRR